MTPTAATSMSTARSARTLDLGDDASTSDDASEALIHGALREGAALRERLRDQTSTIAAAATTISAALQRGGKLLLCGNGGSAADCQHIAAELVGRFSGVHRPGLAALALTTDTSALTAVANDFGYEQVFARQLEALGRGGDVLLCISTSGRSPSILRAAERARSLGITTIALTGAAPSPLGTLADLTLAVPGARSDRVQELHITIGHILCDLVERSLCGGAILGGAR